MKLANLENLGTLGQIAVRYPRPRASARPAAAASLGSAMHVSPAVVDRLVSPTSAGPEQGNRNLADAAELAGEWQVTHLAGAPVIEDSRLALRFADAGDVSGNASCNRFSGVYTADARSLQIGGAHGMLATTRMMCPESVMQQEAQFLQLIPAIDAYERTADGTLILRASGVEVLRAKRS